MVAISTTTDSSSGVRAGGRPGWARVRSDASPSSPKYGLLRVLSLNAGRVCTYEDLIRRVWGNKSGNPKLVRAFVKKPAPQTPTAPSPTPPSRRGGGSTRTSADLHRRGFVGAEFQGEGTLWGFYGLNHVVQARTLWDVDVDSTPCRRTTSAVSTERPPGRCGSCTNPSSGPSWSTSR